jgi:hypothetical protein
MKNTVFVLLVLLTGSPVGAKVFYVHPPADPAGAVVIDHNCVDLSSIPQIHIAPAASLRLLLRHASVGQGIGWGLDCFAGLHPTNSECSCYPPGQYQRDNWVLELRAGNWKDKVDDLVTQAETRTDEFDVFTMKFCYIDALGDSHPDWDYYRAAMEQLDIDYPDKVFVWWTIPLTRDGMPGTDFFNALVRSYCRANGKILFDIADIECHDPNGLKHTNAQGNEVICADYTKEIHAGHLNVPGRIRVASALWQLMASIAGWHKGSIQAAIDAASNGDTIVVEEGTYFENVNFRGKNIVLTSTDPNNPDIVASTIIDGMGNGSVVTFNSGEDANCVLSGLTITGGDLFGIYCSGANPIIKENIITKNRRGIFFAYPTASSPAALVTKNIIFENVTSDGGGGISCDIGTPKIIFNIIQSNSTRYGGGIACYDGSTAIIMNNLVYSNSAETGGGVYWGWGNEVTFIGNTVVKNRAEVGGGLYVDAFGRVSNSIIWGNEATVRDNDLAARDFPPITYCDIGDDRFRGLNGNICEDPLFADLNNNDYHLKSQAGRWDANEGRWTIDEVTSPCIDAGDPMTPIGREPFPNGGRINMGAYGGTAEASKSYFGKPPCEIIVAGDINGDCAVNFLDFRLMALRWLTNGNL